MGWGMMWCVKGEGCGGVCLVMNNHCPILHAHVLLSTLSLFPNNQTQSTNCAISTIDAINATNATNATAASPVSRVSPYRLVHKFL